MDTIASQTTFQPRLLKDPHDPVNSEWELAIHEPNTDDESFGSPNLALGSGLHYLAEKWDPCGSAGGGSPLGLRMDIRRLRIVILTTVCVSLPISEDDAFADIRKKCGYRIDEV